MKNSSKKIENATAIVENATAIVETAIVETAIVETKKKTQSDYSLFLLAFKNYKDNSKSVGSARALLLENKKHFDAKHVSILERSKKVKALYEHIAQGCQKTKTGTTCAFWVMRYVVTNFERLNKISA